MLTHSLEKFIVDIVMVERHTIGVLQRNPLGGAEIIGWLVELGNLFFGQIVICTLQKTRVQSREAIVVARDFQTYQFDQLFWYGSARTGR